MRVFFAILFLAILAPVRSVCSAAPSSQFNNPIVETLADPMMFRSVHPITGEVTYYLAGTSFERYRSRDMVHWERLSNWSNVNQAKSWPGANNQSISGVWACEVAQRGSMYYLYFCAVKPSGDRRVVYVATSTGIEGVFTIQPTPVIELVGRNAIDPHTFRDPVTGYDYLYYTQDQGTDPDNIARVYVVRLREDMLAPQAGGPHTLCVAAETQGWESRWMEGTVVREHNGWYYLFYSSRCYCSDAYALGYATANSPVGPWTKFTANPIFQAATSGLGKVSGPGHVNLVKSPDGTEDWMVYHAHIATAAGGQRHTCIDRYRFVPNPGSPDSVVIDGPTLGLQPMPSGALPLPADPGVDTFDNATQLSRTRWSQIREEDAAYYTLNGSQLSITPRTGSLFTDGVDAIARNVMLQKAPDTGSWFADTDLSFAGIPSARQREVHGGLVAWHDSRHYVAGLMDAAGGLRLDVCNQTFGNRETLKTNLFLAPFPGVRFLRLAYDGSTRSFTFLVSADRLSYTPVATVNSPLSDSRQTFAGLTAFTKAGTAEISGAAALFNWLHIDQQNTWRYVAPWESWDLGTPALQGTAFVTGPGAFTVSGGGPDIWTSSDGGHFLSREMIGNGEIIARVLNVEGTHSWAKAGVMLRADLSSGSANVFACMAPSQKAVQVRKTPMGSTTSTNNSQTLPHWLKLGRTGDVFTAYESPDGSQWTQFGTPQTVIMPSKIRAGLAVTSHDNAKLCRADFSNVQVLQRYHWPFDADAQDAMGGLSSTAAGQPEISAQRILGTGSLELDGNAHLVLDPHEALQDRSFSRTVSFWIKPRSVQGNRVIYEEGGSTNGFAVRLSGSSVQAGIAVDSQLASVSLPGIQQDVWQFVAVTFDGAAGNPGSLAVYFAGQFAGRSDAPSHIPAQANGSAIGGVNDSYAFGDGGLEFAGFIDDFRITEGAAEAPLSSDADQDGLTDAQERTIGTSPTSADSDGDGIPDGFEVLYLGSDPLAPGENFKVGYDTARRAFVVPSISNFSFVFEQFDLALGVWSLRAGPFETGGDAAFVPLDQLGFSTGEASVLLRVKVASPQW